MNYPRYKPGHTRAPGHGAFSDYSAFVLSVSLPRLKTCRIDRRSRVRGLKLKESVAA